MAELRDRTEALCEIASKTLRRRGLEIRLEVDRWEDTPPHVVDANGVNAEFVERALASHAVVALLKSEIRPGTLEELDAVLEAGHADVAVFCFESPDKRTPELVAFLTKWQARILYKETGAPDSDSAWCELARFVIDLTIRVMIYDGESDGYVDQY